MNTETIKITSHFSTLAEAVKASGIDLSYNEREAQRSIRDTDRNVERAFITENGDVYFVFKADIKLLHKFTPFVSVLSDSDFRIAFIEGDYLSLGGYVPKTKAGRAWFKANACGAIAA